MKSLHDIPAKQLDSIIESRIDAITQLKQLPENKNLFFSGTYGGHQPLLLEYDQAVSASSLLFRVEDKQPLSLGNITVQTREGLAFTAQLPSKTAAECTNASCDTTTPGIMTTTQDEPALACLHFPEPVGITTISVTNRERELWRNHSLSVTCRDNNKEQCLFSHQELVTTFMNGLTQSRNRYESDPKLFDCVEVLDTILLTLMYDACPKTMMDLSIADIALLGAIKDHVSKKIFYPMQKEITPHGIVRSFRFWSEQERMEYLQDAVDVVTRLENISPHVTFSFGSVLGFVREKDCFIPHDDDHDITILFPESRFSCMDDAYAHTEQYLQSQGMELLGRLEFVTKVAGPRSRKEVDVFVALVDEQGFITMHPYFRGKYLHVEMILPIAKSTVWGIKCNVPHNIIDYLEATYGPHWRTPLNSSFTSEHNRIHVEQPG